MRIYNDLTGEIEEDGTPDVVSLGGSFAKLPSQQTPTAQPSQAAPAPLPVAPAPSAPTSDTPPPDVPKPAPVSSGPVAAAPAAPANGGANGGATGGAPTPFQTPDPLAFTPLPSSPVTTPMSSMPAGSPAPLPVANTSPSTPMVTMPPATTSPIESAPTPPPTETTALGGSSQIFANDPTRPGSGYILVNGVPMRIEGTTAAGTPGPGGNAIPTANDRYILEGGQLGPNVNVDDYLAWINGQHGANTYTPEQQAINNTPPDTTERYLQDGTVTDANGLPLPQYNTPAGTPSNPSIPAPPPVVATTQPPSSPGFDPTTSGGPTGGPNLAPPSIGPSLPAAPAPITAPPPVQAPVPSSSPTDGNGLPTSPATPSPTTPSPATSTVSPTSVPTQSANPAPSTDANGLPTSSGAMSAVNLTPTTPQNALTNMTIAPGQLADRYSIARQQYDDWVKQTDPQFQAANRDAIRAAAASGTIGSGQLNTSLGDIELNRENAIRSSRDTFLNNALTGSIDDAYRNVGIAQQQQQFQQGQQNTAFNQQVTLQQLSDSELGQQFQQLMTTLGFNAQQVQQAFENAYKVQQLSDDETGQAFYRALQQFIAGTSGDPAQYLTWLAGQYARPTSAAA